MTWHTPRGDRVLEGAEAKVFAVALYMLADMEMLSHCGDPVGAIMADWEVMAPGPFHRLTGKQKWAVMEEVATYLLTPTPEPLPLDAVHENAVFFVYQFVLDFFKGDIYEAEESWGDDVLNAVQDEIEASSSGGDAWPTIGCMDLEKWELALDCLADKILWDRDWEMEAMFPPERGFTVTMAMARIEPWYFQPYEHAGDPAARERVHRMLGKKIDEIEAAEKAAGRGGGKGSGEAEEEEGSGSEDEQGDEKAIASDKKRDSEAKASPSPPPPKRSRRR